MLARLLHWARGCRLSFWKRCHGSCGKRRFPTVAKPLPPQVKPHYTVVFRTFINLLTTKRRAIRVGRSCKNRDIDFKHLAADSDACRAKVIDVLLEPMLNYLLAQVPSTPPPHPVFVSCAPGNRTSAGSRGMI